MAEVIPTVEEVVEQAREFFKENYGCLPSHCGVAPGRVNLIGEHTDYNNGYVLPMALPMVTVAVGKMTDEGFCQISTSSDTLGESNKLSNIQPFLVERGSPQWANYVKGVIANYHAPQPLEPGFLASIATSVPLGGGLSSSAALEVAFYTLLEDLSVSQSMDRKEKALACQRAENDFAGLPCGIMDQFVSIFGEKGHAVLIDCKNLEAELVPFDDPSCAVLITNSNIKHELATSEYAERRAKCYEAASILEIPSLREASVEDIEAKECMFTQDEVMFRRFRHVVSENDRVLRAAEALKKKDYETFGKLMVESHYSLKDDFEVSCPETDQLVDLAIKVEGVFGSRMTGGGFGGCTVTLAKKEAIPKVIEAITAGYAGTPTFYICEASDGARTFALQ